MTALPVWEVWVDGALYFARANDRLSAVLDVLNRLQLQYLYTRFSVREAKRVH